MNTPLSTPSPSLPPVPRLVVRTEVHPADGVGLGRVVPEVAAGDVVAWVRRREGMVGWGRAATATVTDAGPDRWQLLSRWWQAVVEAAVDEGTTWVGDAAPAGDATPVDDAARAGDAPDGSSGEPALPRGAGLVTWASAAFRDDSPAGSALVVPEVVVGRKGDVAWVTRIRRATEGVVDDGAAGGATAGAGADGAPVDGAAVDSSTAVTGLPPESPAPRRPTGIVDEPGDTPDAGWRDVVQRCVDAIRQGRAQKVVLARDVVATAAEPIDLRWLLSRLAGDYPDTWAFAVDGLVGATPEMLVRLDAGHVFSRVLAGTAARAADVEDDQRAADALLASRKDLSEHAFAADSVVERLSPLCSAVVAPRSPALLTLPNLFHLVSDLDGRAEPGTTVLELAGALHPSAAVGGTPREAAQELIAEFEGRDRGRYASPVGWMDARGDGDMGLALRCGRVLPEDPRQLRMWAGGGIVAESDPDAELAETHTKLAPMRSALAGD